MKKDKRPGYLGSSVPDAEKPNRPRQNGAADADLDRIKAELDRLNELLTKKNRDDLDASYNVGWDNLSEDLQQMLSTYEDDISSAKASIQTLADETGAVVEAFAEFRGEYDSMADFKLEVAREYAAISMIASVTDLDGNVTAASIVAAVNDAGSSVMIDADKIQMTGTTTFLMPEDVGDGGSTEIAGNLVSMLLEASKDLDDEFTESDNGLNFLYAPDYFGETGTVARIFTEIDGNITDTTSRYALDIETLAFTSRRNETVYPALKLSAAGRASLIGAKAVYIEATEPDAYTVVDGYDSVRVRAWKAFSALTNTPQNTDYVFCTDGIYYNGVKILST